MQKQISFRTIVFSVAASIFAASAVFGQAVTDAGKSAGDAWRADGEKSVQKAMEWLKSQQHADGSWGQTNFPAMTALGLWAFAQGNHPGRESVCAKAAEFLVSSVQPDGGIYRPATQGRGSGGLSVYNTAICMTALHTYQKSKYAEVILAARKFMVAGQFRGGSDDNNAGGFGYDVAPRPVVPPLLAPEASVDAGAKPVRAPRADLSNTSWALQAMRVTQDLEDLRPAKEGRVDVDWDAALQFVEKLQNRDKNDKDQFGGFGYETSGERGTAELEKSGKVRIIGYGSMTYAGMETMIYAQLSLKDQRVKSSLEWASRYWSVAENPGRGKEGLFYYYNVLSKALALTKSGQLKTPEGVEIPWRAQLVAKLAELQNADGSWVNTQNAFWEGDPMLVTAYSILAIQNAIVP